MEIASLSFSGSCGSRGMPFLAVFTAQNLHPLVHVSPMTINVAVPVSCQHSAMFGHWASSQTVTRPWLRSAALMNEKSVLLLGRIIGLSTTTPLLYAPTVVTI